MTTAQLRTPGMVQVLNKRNDRTGESEKTRDGRWTIIYNDNGEQVEVSESTFKRWYKITSDLRDAEQIVEEPLELGEQVCEEDLPKGPEIKPAETGHYTVLVVEDDTAHRTEFYEGVTQDWIYTRVTKGGFFTSSTFVFQGTDMSKELSSKYAIVKFILDQTGTDIKSLRLPRIKPEV